MHSPSRIVEQSRTPVPHRNFMSSVKTSGCRFGLATHHWESIGLRRHGECAGQVIVAAPPKSHASCWRSFSKNALKKASYANAAFTNASGYTHSPPASISEQSTLPVLQTKSVALFNTLSLTPGLGTHQFFAVYCGVQGEPAGHVS